MAGAAHLWFWRPGRLSWALVLGVCLVAACSGDAGMERASQLLYEHHYVDAERLYRKVLARLEARQPLPPAAQAQRRQVLERLGQINSLYLRDYGRAVKDYEALLSLYPRQEASLAALWAVADLQRHKLGDLPAAIAAYQRLVADFPAHTQARRAQLEIVSCYAKLKNDAQARLEAEMLWQRYPGTPEAAQARFEVADAYANQGHLEQAIDTYESLLRSPIDADLQALVAYELGNCRQEQGQTERALNHYYAALAHHPAPKLVQNKIARVRARLHRTMPLISIARVAPPTPERATRRRKKGAHVAPTPPARAKVTQQAAPEVEISPPSGNNDTLVDLPSENEPHQPVEPVPPPSEIP